MTLDFTGKRVLVTGASTGIGAATAKVFGAAGAIVGVHYHRSEAAARQVAADIQAKGARAILLRGDLMQEAACSDTVNGFAEEAGGLDVLVNNAGGLLLRKPVLEYDTQAFNDTFLLNVTSAFLCSRAAIPHLQKAGGGSILFLSSIATRFGPPGVAPYAAAKAALNGFAMSLAREQAPDNIRVNAVAPGVIDTPFHAATPPERMAALKEMILMKRVGQPEEVAEVILFLASDMARYITGECIDINGGQNMRC
ncbi:MAG: SDR family oxidoreductase [Armatimonadetes bacterium]|nr:SDR family oxidoreductase [Armatimonadota bacterium]